MPYKDDADRFANRRLKRRVARIQRWAEQGFEFAPADQSITCMDCGKVTRYNAPPANRHWSDCKSIEAAA